MKLMISWMTKKKVKLRASTSDLQSKLMKSTELKSEMMSRALIQRQLSKLNSSRKMIVLPEFTFKQQKVIFNTGNNRSPKKMALKRNGSATELSFNSRTQKLLLLSELIQ